VRLEIGGGTNRRAGFRNLDPAHGDEGLRCLVQDGIPLPDNSVEVVYASHVMEHIAQGQPRIDALNEINRVLIPGGAFEIVVPCIGYTDHAHGGAPVHAGWQGYADPTHVSFWWFPESFWYLTGKFAAHASYGLAPWDEGSLDLLDGWEAHVTLLKPKG
jgi:SAM-dependent methyltransferase